jgi:TRAP-type C4-dicarboxylate transport system substrate-binding protein
MLTRRSALQGSVAAAAGLYTGTFGTIANAAAAPITMRFGSDSPIGAPHSKSAVVMKQLVEARTSGRVRVAVFPDAQLGGNGSMTNSVKAGTLDAVVCPVSIISSAVPELDVFCLPFLYTDMLSALRAASSPFGARLVPKVNSAFNCEVAGFTTDGEFELFTKTHPVRKPADMVGLKVGVSTSRIQRDTILALGGIPTVMDITANYASMQTGLINSTVKSREDVINLKVYQVTRYLTLANFYSMPNLLLLSKRFLARLAPQDRDSVLQAGREACEAQRDAVVASAKDSLHFLTTHGLQTVEIENLQAFRDKVESVYKDTGERLGAAFVGEARRLAAM